MRPHRPFLVGLVCWLLIIGGSLGIFRTMKQLGSPTLATKLAMYPYPASVAETILFGTLALFVICGICIYEGQGWARYVYIAVLIPFFVQDYFGIDHAVNPSTAMKIWLAKLVVCAVSVVFLFLPQAKRFFKPPLYIDE